jgi:hypothetical protein
VRTADGSAFCYPDLGSCCFCFEVYVVDFAIEEDSYDVAVDCFDWFEDCVVDFAIEKASYDVAVDCCC